MLTNWTPGTILLARDKEVRWPDGQTATLLLESNGWTLAQGRGKDAGLSVWQMCWLLNSTGAVADAQA